MGSKDKTKKLYISKHPKGNLCLICKNVYASIGYNVKYGKAKKFQKYKKAIAAPGGAEFHDLFLTSRKDWIQLHNEGEHVRLRDAKKLLNPNRRLEVQKV